MGCSNCKKKTIIKRSTTKKNVGGLGLSGSSGLPVTVNDINKTSKRNIFDIDKVAMWAIIIWFLLGVYGLYSLIKNLIEMLS